MNVSSSFPSRLLFVGGAAVVCAWTLMYLLLRKYVGGGVCRSKASLKGKTVIITGANAGIGLETAVDLAKRGARIIMACRSLERGEMAVTKVRKLSCNNDVVFSQLDLASMDSTRQFAERILKEELHIDILINNAGVSLSEVFRTVDGFEVHFGTNHLGHFLLTNLLLDRLKESASARIIVVSSMVHKYDASDKFDFDKVNTDDGTMVSKVGGISRAYLLSKLANALFTHSLNERLQNSSVTVNTLHPGIIASELAISGFFKERSFFFKPLKKLALLLFFKTPWEGAQTTIYCAVSEELEGVSGKFFADCKEVRINLSSQDAERLWELSSQLVGLK